MNSAIALHSMNAAVCAFITFFHTSPVFCEQLQPEINAAEARELLQYSRQILQETVGESTAAVPGAEMQARRPRYVSSGVFVTLVKNNRVRGCYGSLTPGGESLYEQVREYTIAAATLDFRHAPIQPRELKDINIIISFIGSIDAIESISEVDPKTEGLLVRSGDRAAVLLPGEARTASWQIGEAKRQAGIRAGETIELFKIHTATLYE